MNSRETVGPTFAPTDVVRGMSIPELLVGPMTTPAIMRWCAAVENYHRIHYDHDFANDHEGLESVLVNGPFKQALVARAVTDCLPPGGWVNRVRCRHQGQNGPGDLLRITGSVADVRSRADGDFEVDFEVALADQHGVVSCPGVVGTVWPRSLGA